MRRSIQLVSAVIALSTSAVGCDSLLRTSGASESYPYETLLPEGYSNADSSQRWPLILYLHGAGGLIPADDVIPGYARGEADFPFIVIRPKTSMGWQPGKLTRTLEGALDKYRVDPERIYVAGLSMGAHASWQLAYLQPRLFAAVVLVAGGGDPAAACELRHLPVWLFHNQADGVVPVRASTALATALEECGAPDVRLTVYDSLPPGRWHHNAWQATFTDPELYEWLLQHRQPAP